MEPSSTAGADGDGPAAPGIGVFVCYRREDTAGFARALKTVLDERYGEDHVFMDLDSIAPGQRWEDVVNAAVGQCHALMALIGPEWLTIKDSEGRARLWNPHDPVRLEIEAAIRQNVLLIPILLQGARVPAKEDLPQGLAGLPQTQALTITDDWDAGVAKLVKALDAVVRESTTGEPTSTPEPVGADQPTGHESRPDRAAGATDGTTPKRSPTGTVEPTPPRRNLRPMLVAGVLVLAVVGGGIAIAANRHGPTATPPSPSLGTTVNGPVSNTVVHDYLWNVYNLLQQSLEQKTQIQQAIDSKDATALTLLLQRRKSVLTKVQTWEVPPEAKPLNDALEKAFNGAVINVGYWIDYANGTRTRDYALGYQNGTVRPAKYAVDRIYDVLRDSVQDPPPRLDEHFLF